MDGKQARRTGTSGPLGELMDHGVRGGSFEGCGRAVFSVWDALACDYCLLTTVAIRVFTVFTVVGGPQFLECSRAFKVVLAPEGV